MTLAQDNNGIWKHSAYLPQLPTIRKTIGEGNTRLIYANSAYFKCEFENPTGSVKDRGFAYQIAKVYESAVKEAVLSSSGNAAISAATFCQIYNISLTVFVSPKINKKKLQVLKHLPCKIRQSSKPIRDAFNFSKSKKAYNLRQSIDPLAMPGYATIAFEILQQLPDIDALFIPVSSGTTLMGLVSGFKKFSNLPAVHTVQTEAVNPIARLFDKNFTNKKNSLSDAIVAKYTPRLKQITEVIKQTKGYGWVISDKEMLQAKEKLDHYKIICSFEGAATLSALYKANQYGYYYKNPVCLLTGKNYGI